MRKAALIILDGWGLGEPGPHNGIHVAQTPFFDHLWNNYPKTKLQASGEYVGLPEGQIGGSEVGHLTIGAGKVFFQELPRINKALSDQTSDEYIGNNPTFIQLIEKAKTKPLHLIGLLSTGGVHSHEGYFFHLLEILKNYGVQDPWIHIITDGRDTLPTSGQDSIARLEHKLKELQFGHIATICGRFFAMDRDKNWDRTGKYLEVISGQGPSASQNPLEYLQHSYAKEITDEFVEPARLSPEFNGIQTDDTILFWNFRSDRMKQIVTKVNETFPSAQIYTMTRYDKDYTYPVLFQKKAVTNTMGEVLTRHDKKILKAAESEKFPHVTYFFNGGTEIVFDNEHRVVVESNKVKHDQMPDMKAEDLTDAVMESVRQQNPDFILLNYANPDMLGHTGNYDAIIHGIEKVDTQLKRLCEFLAEKGYICCITADHGNADIMFDPITHEVHTAHTLNPVPFIVYDEENKSIQLNQDPANGLSLIAGTVLELMHVHEDDWHFTSLIEK